ncbi:MAG: sulfite exporter TauE/SafE family protein [Actinomycetota bacterium]|nr:sulfite exporter TauE/SafE family protein [Actinomycetota bacterium]
MRRLLLFALVGVLAQLVDGALGMAYGVTASSLLIAGGTTTAVASASVHLAEVATTFVSGVSHWRFGNVNWRTVRWIAIPGAVGAYVGASVLSNIDGAAAKPWIAGLLLVLGLYVFARFAFGVNRKPLPERRLRGRFLAPLGLTGGFVDAIGGGGWGPVTTPALLTAGRMEPRTAVGSASASEFVVSLAASIGFLTNLGGEALDSRIVFGLMLGGVLVAPFAAWLVSRLEAAVLGTLLGTLIVVVNLRTLLIANDVPGGARLAVLASATALGALALLRVHRAVKANAVADASQLETV